MSEPKYDHAERLVSVERDLGALTSSLQQLADTVRQSHVNTTAELKLLGAQMTAFGRPNWTTYIGATALCMTLGAAALGPTWFRLGAVEEQTHKSEESLHRHELLPIHPQALEQMKAMTWRIERLERLATP